MSTLGSHESAVLKLIASLFGLSLNAVDLKSSFVSLGGTSIDAITLSAACKRNGISLSIPSILTSKGILELVQNAVPSIEDTRDHDGHAYRHIEVREPRQRSLSSLSFENSTSLLRTEFRECEDPHHPHHDNSDLSHNKAHTHHHAFPVQRLGHKRKASEMSAGTGPGCGCCTLSTSEADEWDETSVTEMQLLFVHSSHEDPASNVINFSETYELSDLPAVKRAWEKTILQEPDLHVELVIGQNGGVKKTRNPPKFRWLEVYTDNKLDYQQEIDERPCASIVATAFKVVILDRGWHQPSVATVVWRIHHALIDGYSASLVYRKFQRALQGKSSRPGSPFSLAAKELCELQRARASQSQSFWKKQQTRFPAAAGTILLPQPSLGKFGAEKLADTISISSPIERVKATCRDVCCTVASFYCAAWSIVLSRFVASESTVFGLVYSGRSLPLGSASTTIGPLINTLPLYVNVQGSLSVASFLQSVFQSMTELSEVQYARAEDGFDRNFSSAIAMEFDMTPTDSSPVTPIGSSNLDIISNVPLSICVFQTGRIQICYRTSVFRESDMAMLATHLESTLVSLLDVKVPITNIIDGFLTTSCRRQLLDAGNCGRTSTSPGYTSENLVTLFEKSVFANPAKVALIKGSVRLTYGQLHLAAKKVAQQLEESVRPGDIVCVHADRSCNWIIAIYACLNLGAVYAPVDPHLPPQARDRAFRLSGSQLFLTASADQKSLAPSDCRTCLSIEELLASREPLRRGSLPRSYPASSGAYVCFTSGSTSLPKAVLCTHEGLVAFQRTLEVRLFAAPGQRIAQIMSPAFDGSIHEIFSALSYGATLVLASSQTSPVEHLSSVTTALMTPTLLKALDLDNYPDLKTIYVVGEPVPQTLCDEYAGRVALYNMYGPTEATCGATISRLIPHKPVSIGRPNKSSRIYILDEQQRLLPPGVVGEIYLAGIQVAKGYIGLPEQTKTSFLKDTICPLTEERMYRTGDFGYWQSNGEICCLGRRDRQVKLRGFRLDLNNLEQRLAEELPEAQAVAVVLQKNRLVALLQPSTLDMDLVRERATRVLQPQAMPQLFVAVDDFPRTAIDKRDYAAMANLDFTPQKSHKKPNSSSDFEVRLRTLWRQLLGLPEESRVEPEDNFIALGGHSILQLALVQQVSSTFSISIDTRAVLYTISRGSLQDLANLILSEAALPSWDHPSGAATPSSTTSATSSLGTSALSPSEFQWFNRSLNDDVHTQCNVSLAWEVDGSISDLPQLASVFRDAIKRYTIFQSRYFKQQEGCPERSLHQDTEPDVARVSEVDLTREVNRPFDLAKDKLIRVCVSSKLVVLVAHHIVCDLTALKVLLADVERSYNGQNLSPISRTYMQTSWQSPSLAPFSLDTGLREAISARQPRLLQRPKSSSEGTSITINLGTQALRAIKEITRKFLVTPQQIALAAVTAALSKTGPVASAATGDELNSKFLLGSPNMNRSPEDASVVGLFLDPLPVVTSSPLSSSSSDTLLDVTSTGSFLRSVQASSQLALAQTPTWPSVLAAMGIDNSVSPSHLLFDAMVTFHDGEASGQGALSAIPGLKPVLTWAQGAKFRLMCEFTVVKGAEQEDGVLLLRLEYARNVYKETEVWGLAEDVLKALWQMAGDEAMGGKVATPEQGAVNLRDRQVEFGTALADLSDVWSEWQIV